MSRSCTVCSHADRKAIDRAILAGDSNRTLANRYAIGLSAITRHAMNHVRSAAKAQARAITTRGILREAAAAEQHADVVEAAVEQSRTTLDLVIRLRDRATGYLDKAEQPRSVFARDGSVIGEEVDWRAVAALLREARGCLTAQAELLGELAPKRVELSGPGGAPAPVPPVEDTQHEFGFGEVESRGHFEKTDRNLFDGYDLDVPAYLRKGVKISL